MKRSTLLAITTCVLVTTSLLFQNCSTPTLDSVDAASSAALQISSYPTSQQVTIGQSLTLSVSAYSAVGSSVRYQWYKNGSLLSGATTNTLFLSYVTSSDIASYLVQVTDGTNTAWTQSFSLYLGSGSSSLTITSAPIAQTVAPGSVTRFAVAATDGAGSSLTYQWLKNGAILSGQTASEMYITSTTAADAGYYSVEISNGSTTIRSNAVLLTVAATAASCAASGGSLYGSHCYVVNRNLTTWDAAETICQGLGGHLAIITTLGENTFIYSITQTAVWIGARDVVTEGTYLWADGTTVSYGGFSAGEPNGGTNENCLQMTPTGYWNDLSCGATRAFVCEI